MRGGTGKLTSISGNLSFRSLMDRCAKPSGLKDSSAVSVFKCSGVCSKAKQVKAMLCLTSSAMQAKTADAKAGIAGDSSNWGLCLTGVFA